MQLGLGFQPHIMPFMCTAGAKISFLRTKGPLDLAHEKNSNNLLSLDSISMLILAM